MICYLGKYPENNHTINNEPIGKIEWQDLQGGMTVVNDLVERQGIPVFDLIDVALECATKVRLMFVTNVIFTNQKIVLNSFFIFAFAIFEIT